MAAHRLVVFGACFVADGTRHTPDKRWVPRRGQADRLWEHSRAPVARHAMQRLTPVIIRGDVQARDRGRVENQLPDFFL
jgi:hypothetical protein